MACHLCGTWHKMLSNNSNTSKLLRVSTAAEIFPVSFFIQFISGSYCINDSSVCLWSFLQIRLIAFALALNSKNLLSFLVVLCPSTVEARPPSSKIHASIVQKISLGSTVKITFYSLNSSAQDVYDVL